MANICNGFHENDDTAVFDKIKSNMVYKKLGQTDMKISKLGIGGVSFGNHYGFCSEDDVKDIILTGFRVGVNYIDTSPFYGVGRSELVIGKVLSSLMVTRHSFYISTKVGRNDQYVFDFSSKRVVKSIDESLKRLQLDYIDIVFAHDIEFAPSIDIIINETLPTLKKLKNEGKIRYIGIGGYPLQLLKKVVERSKTKIDVVLTYCHYSLNDTSLLDYISFFKSKGIGLINASPLSLGLLSPCGPMPWHCAGEELLVASKNTVAFCKNKDVSIAKLGIHFSCSNEMIDATLSSFNTKEQVLENTQAALFGLNEHEKTILQHIKKVFFDPVQNKTWKSGTLI